MWVFLPSAYSFVPFCNLATISCRTTLLFLLCHYLTLACWASLGLLLILLLMTQCGHLGFILHSLWALLSYLFPLGHPWPICFPWASLAIFLTLCSHGLLLIPLDFSGLITLSFILGVHRLAINPLLSLLALLRACCGLFSFFYITYYPWVWYFSLSRAPLGLFASSRPICLFYRPMIHYSCHLGLMVFLSIY